jgi:hypothetical protein
MLKTAVVLAFPNWTPLEMMVSVTTSETMRTWVLSLPGEMITPGGDSGGATSARAGPKTARLANSANSAALAPMEQTLSKFFIFVLLVLLRQ